MVKYSKFILVPVILLFLFYHGTTQQDDGTTRTRLGQQVPEFTGKTLDGRTLSISDLRGNVVLINFFATWCGPCMKEMPMLEEKVWKPYQDKKFVLIAIGREHTLQELKTFNQKKNFSFVLMEDPQRAIYSKFATQFIPRNILLDEKGKIIFQTVGYTREDFENLEKQLRRIVKD